jgi:small subunit ribosomal protein S1
LRPFRTYFIHKVGVSLKGRNTAIKKQNMEETTLFDQNLSAGQAGAHDDFDWSVDKRNVSTYNQNDRETYDKQYEQTFQAVNNNEMVMGAIVGLTKTDAVVNIQK